jgi:hypothetical protein
MAKFPTTGDDPNATRDRLSDVIDDSRVLETHISGLIRAGNMDKQANPMIAILRVERQELWKRIETREREAEIYKEQDIVLCEHLADDPFSCPVLKGSGRAADRLHRHHSDVFGPIFTSLSRLDKAEPFAESATTTGVLIRTRYNRNDASKADGV